MVIDLPSQPIGRSLYIFFAGASVLSSKLIVTNLRFGFILLLILIFWRFSNLGLTGAPQSLGMLLGGDFLNPVYGLAAMFFNYDTFLVLPHYLL